MNRLSAALAAVAVLVACGPTPGEGGAGGGGSTAGGSTAGGSTAGGSTAGGATAGGATAGGATAGGATAGGGAPQGLSWAPIPVDFGYVTPGLSKQQTLTFQNGNSTAVTVTLAQPMSTEFSVVSSLTVNVPANGMASATLQLRPAVLGPRQGTLTFTTSLASQPTGQVILRGFGGGPDIDVPAAVAFGQVAYFAGTSQSRSLRVSNVGTLPVPADPNGNLHVGTLTVTPNNAQSTAAELTVALPASYSMATGILASPPNFADLDVRLTPASVGMKSFTVTVASNDADEPTVSVSVTAEVLSLPACMYSVSPASLDFGLVPPGAAREQTVTIRNTGTSSCVISDVRLATGAPAGFSVEAVPSSVVLAGATLPVRVRLAPDAAATAVLTSVSTGLQFQVSAPSPLVTVPITAQLGTECLIFSAHALDFGNIQLGCRSPTRTVTLYNVCATPVTFASVSAGSTDLTVTTTLTAGTLITQSISRTVGVVFRPSAAGAFHSTVRLTGTQNGQSVTYVIPVDASATATATPSTETFSLAAQPKADVLLVVDNSCSMMDKQTALGNNFASLTAYATVAAVDWQLGVVTSDAFDPTAGQLIAGPTNQKILRPTTPNVAALFQSRVNVGLAGSSQETVLLPAALAVSSPLNATANAGFLRRDAVLGVIGISDAEDQSALPLELLVARLRNTKERPGDVTFSGMRPMLPMPPGTCLYDDFTGGTRFATAVAELNGVSEEICTANWPAALQNIGKVAFGYRTRFWLNVEPDTTQPITVRVNGVVVPPTSAGGPVWALDPATFSLNFEPLYVPAPGDTLTVEYSVACIP